MSTLEVKYPGVEVQLVGRDGNAGAIMARVVDALERHFATLDMTLPERRAEVKLFREEAMSGDYDHLLQTVMRWVEVC